jgi:hypothetical protein
MIMLQLLCLNFEPAGLTLHRFVFVLMESSMKSKLFCCVKKPPAVHHLEVVDLLASKILKVSFFVDLVSTSKSEVFSLSKDSLFSEVFRNMVA